MGFAEARPIDVETSSLVFILERLGPGSSLIRNSTIEGARGRGRASCTARHRCIACLSPRARFSGDLES